MAKIKWTEQDVIEHARNLKNPFEDITSQNKLPNKLPNFGERIKELITRNKEVKV